MAGAPGPVPAWHHDGDTHLTCLCRVLRPPQEQAGSCRFPASAVRRVPPWRNGLTRSRRCRGWLGGKPDRPDHRRPAGRNVYGYRTPCTSETTASGAMPRLDTAECIPPRQRNARGGSPQRADHPCAVRQACRLRFPASSRGSRSFPVIYYNADCDDYVPWRGHHVRSLAARRLVIEAMSLCSWPVRRGPATGRPVRSKASAPQ